MSKAAQKSRPAAPDATGAHWPPADRERVKAVLAAALPWTALDFVPGLSRAADRDMTAARWTRGLPASDDLCFSTFANSSVEIAVLAERLPWDSEFFGYGVARLNAMFPLAEPLDRPDLDLGPAVAAILKLAAAKNVRYLFSPVDARDLALARALGESGFALIETRLFHHGAVSEPALKERTPVRRACPDDIPSLSRVARETINRYDRFHADPYLDRSRVDRLMETWVAESVHGRMADVVIVPDEPEPAAFVAYRYHRESWDRWGVRLAQGVLSAVSPASMGWMDRLGPELEYHLSALGVTHVFGSTQATNRAILWHAQDRGARLGRCELIFRKILD